MPHYIAFPITDALAAKSNRFLEAVNANDAAKAGALFAEIMADTAELLTDTLLLMPLSMAKLNSMMDKLVRVCANTGTKVAGMLSGKLYKKATIEELRRVATLWESMIKDFGDGKGWRLSTPLDADFTALIETMLEERGTAEVYVPKDIRQVIATYERLSDTIIDAMFLRASSELSIGPVTSALRNTGISSVKSTIQAVMENVIGKLPHKPLTDYIDYTLQFYVKA